MAFTAGVGREGHATGIQEAKVRDAVKDPAMFKTALPHKAALDPKCK